MKTLGFIGCGHIAKSLITGLKRDSDYEIIGYDKMQDSLDWLKMQIFFSYVLNLKICLHYAKNCLQQLIRTRA